MRRATDYEHLDDDGECEPNPALAARRRRLEDSVRLLQLRYARLSRQIGDLAERYGAVANRGEQP